ncbi:MAG TPA: FtsX-like permease family protein, partial [Ilumatobacteraceae bacterium]|nr:FtsX-like permease family protein [Ilumatobacteraceae bacterium]
AVLRALGSDSRQLRAIIHWQASLVAGLVLLLGLPSGVIVGRRIVGLLTSALGIVPGAEVSPLLVLAVVVIAGVTANLLALMPARRAARTPVRELMLDR